MTPRESVAKIRRAIAAQFPLEAEAVDAQMLDYDDDAYDTWIERFCDTTNEAMARRDEPVVQAHLAFMAQQLAITDDDGRSVIDVAYAENMMWNLDLDGKRWAWPRVPTSLQELYARLWGEPRL